MAQRILHVTGNLVGGGAETQLKLLARGLDRNGWQTGIIYLGDDPNFTDRGTIQSLPVERGAKWDLIGLNNRICRAIEAFKPEVIHTWLPEIMTLPAALYARRHKIPCLSGQRCSLRYDGMGLKGRLRDMLIPVNHWLATDVVCNFSYDLEPAWVRSIIKSRNGSVIRNGLRLTKDKATAKPAWLDKDAFKILFVGRLEESKRANLLIEAATQLQKEGHTIQIGIYGQGTQEAKLKALANQLGLQEGKDIAFMGYQPNWQAQAAFYDLFALPTLAEGMPNVLVEAMGQGLPALSTDIFEISSFVRNGEDAWLVTPDSAEALTDGLRTVITDPELCARLSKSGKELAESFSEENMIRAYEDVYRSMLASA